MCPVFVQSAAITNQRSGCDVRVNLRNDHSSQPYRCAKIQMPCSRAAGTSGGGAMIETMRCAGADFCEELTGCGDTSFTRFYEGDPPSRAVCSTENLTLLADMSPLVLGHLLLLPSNHYLSFAQVLSRHEHEVRSFLADFVPLYRETFGEPLILGARIERGTGEPRLYHARASASSSRRRGSRGRSSDRRRPRL